MILFVSFSFNLWVLVIFEVKSENNNSFCDIKKEWTNEYFQLTILYVIFVILIPIIIIFLFNTMTICKTFESSRMRRTKLQAKKVNTSRLSLNTEKMSSITVAENTEIKSFMRTHNLKPYYVSTSETSKQSIAQLTSSNSVQKITAILMVISFSYCTLNIPYLCTWFVYFSEHRFGWYKTANATSYLLVYTRIAETIQILNYSLHLFYYCIAGSLFRKQLKNSGDFIVFDVICCSDSFGLRK